MKQRIEKNKQGPTWYLDAIINHWSFWDEHERYYLKELLPSLMRNPSSGDAVEERLISELRPLLTEDEWTHLPVSVTIRVKGGSPSFEYDLKVKEEERIATLVDELSGLLLRRDWDAFDLRLASEELPDAVREDLLAAKNRGIWLEEEENEAERQRAEVAELKNLIACYDWCAFDKRLLVARLPVPTEYELNQLKNSKIEEKRQEDLCEFLTSLISKKQWNSFDEAIDDAKLPKNAISRLVELKSEKLAEAKFEEERKKRQQTLASLRLLIKERCWHDFDIALLNSKLEPSDRENLLKEKAAELRESLGIALDDIQSRILASPAKTFRVTARAGSGKTRLLTAFTQFLVEGYRYTPDEILLLAFNRDAASQLEDRLTKLLKIPAFSGARTFHSLAYGVAAPEQEILYDTGDSVAGKPLSSLVQDILVGLLDDELLDRVYDLFRRETTEAKSTGAFLQGEDAYDFRRALRQYTLAGEPVKSRGEKFIADFLFEHGIKYSYERPVRWEGSWYRPDFTIHLDEKNSVIWEHWAVDPDTKHAAESAEWSAVKLRAYQAAAKRKRGFWEAKEKSLLESCAQNCGDRESFEAEIATKLEPFFPTLQRLPKHKLISAIKQVHLSKLSSWVGQAIQRAQKQGWDAAALRRALKTHSHETERERLFLSLVDYVFSAYTPRLKRKGKIDFDQLFNEAIQLMRSDPPQTVLRGKQTAIDLRGLRMCLVDEAQDLSPQFVEAVCCLRRLNPALRVLFVGDDWQAINRFAGSDVELFTREITTRLGKCATATLEMNYRSVRSVVLAGNALMRGQGAEAVPHKEAIGIIQLAYLDQVFVEGRKGQPSYEVEKAFREGGRSLEKLLKALYQLAMPDLLTGKTVGVLFRTNQYLGKSLSELEQRFVDVLRKMGWPRDDVTRWKKDLLRFSTAHSFKGAERHTVFVVNPSAGNFPLLNADSIELFRLFGDSLKQAEQDERRLFYVAITRAEERLVFLTEKRRDEDSPYLDTFRELIQTIPVPAEAILPPAFTGRGEMETG